jgi:hypothetical protein
MDALQRSLKAAEKLGACSAFQPSVNREARCVVCVTARARASALGPAPAACCCPGNCGSVIKTKKSKCCSSPGCVQSSKSVKESSIDSTHSTESLSLLHSSNSNSVSSAAEFFLVHESTYVKSSLSDFAGYYDEMDPTDPFALSNEQIAFLAQEHCDYHDGPSPSNKHQPVTWEFDEEGKSPTVTFSAASADLWRNAQVELNAIRSTDLWQATE